MSEPTANTNQSDTKSVDNTKSVGDTNVSKDTQKVTPTIDPNIFDIDGEKITKDQLIERYKKSKGLEATVKDGVISKQQLAGLVQQLKENPLAVLQNPALNLDLKNMLGKWYYENVIVPEKMSPEARKAMEMERELKQLKSQKEEEEKTKQEQTTAQNIQYAKQRILKAIADEIPTSGLPFSADLNKTSDAALVSRITRKLYLANQASKPINIKTAIQQVKQELVNEHRSLMKDYNEDNLLSFYDEDTLEKINKALVKRMKASQKEKEVKKSKDVLNTKSEDLSPTEKRKKMREIERKTFGR